VAVAEKDTAWLTTGPGDDVKDAVTPPGAGDVKISVMAEAPASLVVIDDRPQFHSKVFSHE